MKLRVLDLFSGIGGFSLGLHRTGGFETVAFCEYEDFPRRVLAKHWPDVPCFPDVRELKGSDIDGPIDVICGGYPCQPFSTAGKRLGKEDDRHLWPEYSRLVEEIRPTWVVGENVAGHISMGLDDVLSDLATLGYTARPFVIPACAVDAKHRRDRVWVVAHSNSECQSGGKLIETGGCSQCKDGQPAPPVPKEYRCIQGIDANANEQRLQGRQEARNIESFGQGGNQQPERCTDLPRAIWSTEPNVGRVANGVPSRVDRLKCLGNAVVPQVVKMIGHAILAAHWENEE